MYKRQFKTSGEILDLNNITFFPKDFTLENYTGLFEQFHYGVLLKNSLLVSVASALVVTVFSMLGGYSLARYKFRGKQTVSYTHLSGGIAEDFSVSSGNGSDDARKKYPGGFGKVSTELLATYYTFSILNWNLSCTLHQQYCSANNK